MGSEAEAKLIHDVTGGIGLARPPPGDQMRNRSDWTRINLYDHVAPRTTRSPGAKKYRQGPRRHAKSNSSPANTMTAARFSESENEENSV